MANYHLARKAANRQRRFGLVIVLLMLMLAIVMLLHIVYGRTTMSMEEVVRALFNVTDDNGQRHIVWNLRLPRVLVAIAAGTMLGLAGAILQVVMNNPLMEPGLIGVSSGSVLFVVLTMHYLPIGTLHQDWLPFVAMPGGVMTVGVIYLLGGRGASGIARLALIGVVATSILQSITSLLLLRNQEGLATILLWNFGSLNGRVWTQWNHVWPWALIFLTLAMLMAQKASLLRLGDETAAGLGLSVNRTRIVLLLISAALTAASVSVVGAIGFVGLIGPHIAALLVGRNPLYHFPTSALFSAVLLAASDWASQSVTLKLSLPGLEHHVSSLPVGAVTTLMGAPFFLYLLRKSRVMK